MARPGMHSDYRALRDKLMREIRPSEPRDVAQAWRVYFNEEQAPAAAS
jgi:hypothetical protein